MVIRMSSRLLTSVRNEATVTSMFFTSSAKLIRVKDILPQARAIPPAALQSDIGSMKDGAHLIAKNQ